jgi:hypothetical protein
MWIKFLYNKENKKYNSHILYIICITYIFNFPIPSFYTSLHYNFLKSSKKLFFKEKKRNQQKSNNYFSSFKLPMSRISFCTTILLHTSKVSRD